MEIYMEIIWKFHNIFYDILNEPPVKRININD